MANFFITGADQTGEVLVTGETGVVADSGILFTNGISVTVDGQVELVVLGDIISANNTAIVLGTASDANITVGADGSILASDGAAFNGTYRNTLSIQNAGVIAGDESGIILTMENVATQGVVLVTNSGTIRGAGSSGIGGGAISHVGQSDTANRFVLVNTGTITHGSNASVILTDTAADITNSGTMTGLLSLTGTEADRVSNAGLITGDILFAINADTLSNTGTIQGDVFMGDGADSLTNHGMIVGDLSMGNMPGGLEGATDSADELVNTGLIDGDIFLSAGSDIFRNAGGRVLGTIFGGFGADTFIIDRSDLDIRDSTDGTTSGTDQVASTASFTLRAGIENLTLVGTAGLTGRGNAGDNFLASSEGGDTLFAEDGGDIVNGNAGNDALYGGRGGDLMSGGDGDDAVFGGRDSDSLSAGDGADTLDGGAGDDTLLVGVEGGVLRGGHGFDTASFLGIQTAMTLDLVSGVGVDATGTAWTMAAVEALIASFGNDTLTGNSADNRLEGFDGNDLLSGGTGNDTLLGDDGADTLGGGNGADVFLYRNTPESLAAGPDLITDFSRNSDLIDLSDIDANLGLGGDQAFAFLGSGAFTGAGPELRFFKDVGTNTTTVEVRLAGSVANDMVIVLTGQVNLTAANFDL